MSIKLGRVTVELHPVFLTEEERAMPYSRPQPESVYHEWLTQRYFAAVDAWRNGAPLMLCVHLRDTPDAVLWWFPAYPDCQVCRDCGQRIRAALGAFPRPRNYCDACCQDIDHAAWMTNIDYDTPDWFTTSLVCQSCVASFGFQTASEIISDGVDELEQLSNSCQR
jgi:hypothetical protein